MRVLEVYRSRALSLMCEVALILYLMSTILFALARCYLQIACVMSLANTQLPIVVSTNTKCTPHIICHSLLTDLEHYNYCHIRSDFSSESQPPMTIFYHQYVGMQNTPIVV
jgi:hypothetical protein